MNIFNKRHKTQDIRPKTQDLGLRTKDLGPKTRGFTLIELVMSIVLMGILISAVALGYQQIITGIFRNSSITKAIGLARTDMAIANVLDYSNATLAGGYNNTTTNYLGSGYDLNRTVNYAAGGVSSAESLKKITVKVVPTGRDFVTSLLFSATTYRAKNVAFGAGSQGSGTEPSTSTEAELLAFSSPHFTSRKNLYFTLANTSATTTITISSISIAWTQTNTLKNISLFSTWVLPAGSYASGSDLASIFTATQITAGNSSSTNYFAFNDNFPNNSTMSFSVIFYMSDGSSKQVNFDAST